jgi:hypothetical protein
MFQDAQTTMIWLKSQIVESKFDFSVTIRTCRILQIMNSFLFAIYFIFGEDITKTFVASNKGNFYHSNVFMYKLHLCFIMMKVAFMA